MIISIQHADAVSDKIVDVLNENINISPASTFAGLLLGLFALMEASPPNKPPEVIELIAAAHKCLLMMDLGPDYQKCDMDVKTEIH